MRGEKNARTNERANPKVNQKEYEIESVCGGGGTYGRERENDGGTSEREKRRLKKQSKHTKCTAEEKKVLHLYRKEWRNSKQVRESERERERENKTQQKPTNMH